MSDAEHIKAKLAGLQIHLAYLEGWLSTHKGAIQEFKMRTLYDIVTGKKKYVVATSLRFEHSPNTNLLLPTELDWKRFPNASTSLICCRLK